jgi:hypothetical protein
VAVAQSVWFACGLKAIEFSFVFLIKKIVEVGFRLHPAAVSQFVHFTLTALGTVQICKSMESISYYQELNKMLIIEILEF